MSRNYAVCNVRTFGLIWFDDEPNIALRDFGLLYVGRNPRERCKECIEAYLANPNRVGRSIFDRLFSTDALEGTI